MEKIKLEEKEKKELEKFMLSSKNAYDKKRVECILLSNNLGIGIKELSKHFGVTLKTVYSWFKKWTEKGLSGLVHQGGTGAKKKLKNVSINDLESLLKTNGQNLKVVLAHIETTYQISVSKKTLTRFLKKREDTNGKGLEKV
jgi:transposase